MRELRVSYLRCGKEQR